MDADRPSPFSPVLPAPVARRGPRRSQADAGDSIPNLPAAAQYSGGSLGGHDGVGMPLSLLRSPGAGRALQAAVAVAAASVSRVSRPASSLPTPPLGPTKERSYWSYLRRLLMPPRGPPYERVCQVGDPILRSLAAPVEVARVGSVEVQALIRSLVRAMRRERCVALSAPQLGVPLQLFVAELPEELWRKEPPTRRRAQEMRPFQLRVVLNPSMRVLDAGLLTFPEGCRSISGFAASVARFRAVELSGLDETGQPITWQASGWAARIIQHEMDHLRGILYIDKMDSKTFVNLDWAANE